MSTKFLWFDTSNHHQPKIRTKTNIFGSTTANETLSKRRNILITGAHHSGKTRYLSRLHNDAEKIWYHQLKPYAYTRNKTLENKKPMRRAGVEDKAWEFPEPVFLCGIAPLGKWISNDGVINWWNEKNPEQPFKKLPAFQRVELLPEYLKDTRAVLFIDDAHKLTGRKLQIAKMCLGTAYRSVITASDENKISPSIRRAFLETKPQVVRLNSDVAYDATHILVWMFVVLLFVGGMQEMAALLSIFEMMKGGRRASKQD
jgi:hypothetical protein